ncbi:MAG TPA: hypothetical protein VF744_16160 [Beijerinckiaceae bacterium]|jgi:hypothetical protein
MSVAINLKRLERSGDGGWLVVFEVRGFTAFEVPVTLGPGFPEDVEAVRAARGALRSLFREAAKAAAADDEEIKPSAGAQPGSS